MKKFLPTILIAIILVNLFAPFRLQVEDSRVEVKKSEAEAADVVGIVLRASVDNTDTTISTNVTVTWYIDRYSTQDGVSAILQKTTGEIVGTKKTIKVTTDEAATAAYRASHPNDPREYTVQRSDKNLLLFPNLAPNTDYRLTIVATQNIDFWSRGILDNIANTLTGGSNHDAAYLFFDIHTNEDGNATVVTTEGKEALSLDLIMPPCSITGFGNGTIAGCVGQLVYYALLIPTSYIFALAGQLFDWAFMYSVNDDSYRTSFVVEGWGIVRDFVNMFFIFVLLYVAFATILKLHGAKPKEMIMNVVIIGLLINFSLFATRVIIDTSNILARVFYNSDAIKITEGGANCTLHSNEPGCMNQGQGKAGPNGEIALYVDIVNKINPKNLIINGIKGTKLDVRDAVTGETSRGAEKKDGDLGAGAFILITVLAIAVNVTGIIVFFSVALIFIARVIGLWLATIFVPFAFFSYTVPKMKGIEMVGWEHWWPETLKLAFLAPVFIFFLYLILKFLEKGLTLFKSDADLVGVPFILSIIVPFIFLMALLWKAKGIASKMSGEMGQAITGGIAAAGGIVLGGAALGTAFLGRNLIGKTMSKASQTDSAKHLGKYKANLRDYQVKSKEHAVAMKVWRAGGNVGARPTAPVAPRAPIVGEHLGYDKKGNASYYKPGVLTSLGASLNAKQSRIEKSDHEAHEVDAVKDKRYKGTDWKNLTGTQQNNVREDYIKDNRSKHTADIEEKVRNNSIPNGTGRPLRPGQTLTVAQRKTVTDETTKFTGAKFDHAVAEASKSIGGLARNLAKVNTASFDARNISKMEAPSRSGLFTKASAGLIAGIAMGVRTGLKTSGVNHGSGQGDIIKDLGHTITEALKSMKINVKVEKSDGHGGDDGHAGGGAHH